MTISLTYEDNIAILDLGGDENRFSPSFLDDINARFDEIVAGGAHGLVTMATGKFYTNGLDLDWLAAHSDQTQWYVGRMHGLLARMLSLPIPTAAAIVGHAFGAGAMLAVAHDFRVMRADRGYFCFPEVDLNIPFTQGMAALIQAKLTPHAAAPTPHTWESSTQPRARARRKPPQSICSARSAGRTKARWARSSRLCSRPPWPRSPEGHHD